MEIEKKLVHLKESYSLKREKIQARLREFEAVYQKDDETVFQELAYCIFTAGSSARTGLASVEAIKDILMIANVEEIAQRLRGIHRYAQTRAEYLVHTRDYLMEECGFKIKEKIETFSDRERLRDFFADNKGIKGLGYKEASHFLRNIGFKGYAILDIHILNSLYEFKVIDRVSRPTSKRRYLEIEEKMKQFASQIGINFDELDLLLWSERTGEILK